MADIRLASNIRTTEIDTGDVQHLMTPGDVITSDVGFMRGHGTFMQGENLHASVAGVVERVNKLICVKPLKTRYVGEVGDVVIGRVLEVGQKRWKIDTNTKLDSVLMLSSVNLPGGELGWTVVRGLAVTSCGKILGVKVHTSESIFAVLRRRRSEEDERMMRDYLSEGDLISAEVQNVMSDGCLSLHTRSLKYGKLGQGVMVKVSPSLVKRRKTHFHNLPVGASIILGNNGYIWICPTINEDTDNTGGFIQNLEPIPRTDREVVARLRNCVLAMANRGMLLFDTSILYAFENSQKYPARDILKPEISQEVVDMTRQRLELET